MSHLDPVKTASYPLFTQLPCDGQPRTLFKGSAHYVKLHVQIKIPILTEGEGYPTTVHSFLWFVHFLLFYRKYIKRNTTMSKPDLVYNDAALEAPPPPYELHSTGDVLSVSAAVTGISFYLLQLL